MDSPSAAPQRETKESKFAEVLSSSNEIFAFTGSGLSSERIFPPFTADFSASINQVFLGDSALRGHAGKTGTSETA